MQPSIDTNNKHSTISENIHHTDSNKTSFRKKNIKHATAFSKKAHEISKKIDVLLKGIKEFFENFITNFEPKRNDATPLSERVQLKAEQITPHVEGISSQNTQTFFFDDGRVSIIREAEPFERCVITGGGVKGLCLASFISSLNKKMPFLESLKEISGTSAGSTMALLLAAGLSPKEVDVFLSDTNVLGQLIGDDHENIQLGKGIFTANNLTRSLDSLSRNSACQYMTELITNAPEKLSAIAKEVGYESFIEKATNSFPEGLTFNDLRLLNILNPKKFKCLHITGYDTVAEKVVYYNAQNSPDMLCYIACRVSIAIPVLFKSVVIDDVPHSDGGIGSNIPLETFSSRPDYKPETTMVLAFDNAGRSNEILHNPLIKPKPRTMMQKILRVAMKSLGYDFLIQGSQPRRSHFPSALAILIAGKNFPQSKENDAQKLYEKGPGTFVVPHGDLGTASFAAQRKTIEKAKYAAKQAGKNYAALYKDHTYHKVYASTQEAFNSLSEEEKKQLKPLASQNLNRTDLLSSQQEFYRQLNAC